MKTENKRVIDVMNSITKSIALNDRVNMIATIDIYAGDELTTAQSWKRIAEETDAQIRQRLVGVYEYYENELI